MPDEEKEVTEQERAEAEAAFAEDEDSPPQEEEAVVEEEEEAAEPPEEEETEEEPEEKEKVEDEAEEEEEPELSAKELAEEVKKHIPEFECTYEPDFRQKIADSWPKSIDDSDARKDWGWKHEYDLAKMTEDMLDKLKVKLGK